MKYPNAEYRAREVRAKKAIQNLLVRCDWRMSERPTFLPPVLQEGVNVRGADLVLIASGGDHPFGLYEALREAPLDVLIVETAITMDSKPIFAATLLRRQHGRILKTPCLRFWFDAKGACFL